MRWSRQQDVDQKAADELVNGERHHLGPIAPFGAVVLPAKCHAGVVEWNEPAVRDGDPVSVERQVGQHRLGPAERALVYTIHSALCNGAR